MFDNMEKEVKKINEMKKEYRTTAQSIRTEHTKIKRIQSKLQSNQSAARRASQYHNQSAADRSMSSMSFQSSRTSIRSFQSG